MHRTALALALTLSFAGAALAQERPPPRVTLNLREALHRAAADPPAVTAALARLSVSEAQIGSARAGYIPTVTATASGNIGFSDQPVLSNLRYQSVNVGASVGLQARIPIYDFGRTASAVEAATRGRNAAREDLRTARVQAMGATAVAYLTVLNDREAIAAAQAIVAQREAQHRIADGLVTAGTRPPIERTRAELNLEVSRLDLTAAEARERLDRAALAAAMGIDPLSELQVEAVDDGLLRADDDPARASAAAVAHRPEFAAARARVLQAEAQAEGARAALRPVFSGVASASVNYTERLVGQGAFGLSEQLQAGLSISWPAFDPSVRANLRVTDANLESARTALAQQSLTVRGAAVQAAINLRAAAVSLEQTTHLAATAAANLEQAEGRYRSGAAPLLETVDAQAADASARIAVVRARLQLQVARINLLTSTGELERLLD